MLKISKDMKRRLNVAMNSKKLADDMELLLNDLLAAARQADTKEEDECLEELKQGFDKKLTDIDQKLDRVTFKLQKDIKEVLDVAKEALETSRDCQCKLKYDDADEDPIIEDK